MDLPHDIQIPNVFSLAPW